MNSLLVTLQEAYQTTDSATQKKNITKMMQHVLELYRLFANLAGLLNADVRNTPMGSVKDWAEDIEAFEIKMLEIMGGDDSNVVSRKGTVEWLMQQLLPLPANSYIILSSDEEGNDYGVLGKTEQTDGAFILYPMSGTVRVNYDEQDVLFDVTMFDPEGEPNGP